MVSAKQFLALGAAAIAVGAGPSLAEDTDQKPVEISGDVTAVGGVSDGKAKGDVDARIKVKGSKVLNNGVEVGAVVGARLDGQQAAQTVAGGRYSGHQSGGPRGVGPLSSDAYVQEAYGFARGGFGQLNVGRDQGVAKTLAVTSPTIFRSLNVNDWRTDLSGLNDVHTINDFSGYATKFSYMPPANFLGGVLGGLQLGVSYSPTLRNCGERLCAPDQGFILAPDGTLLNETSRWEDVVEGALYYQKGIKLGAKGDERLLLGVGASVVTASEDVQALSRLYGDYEAYSVGLNLGYRGVTIGGSVKTTNAGLAELDEDGYLAFDAGVTFRTGGDKGDVGVMLGYGQAEASAIGPNPADPILFRDTRTAQAGVTYFLGRGVTIGAAVQYIESTKPDTAGGPEEAATAVIESSIKF